MPSEPDIAERRRERVEADRDYNPELFGVLDAQQAAHFWFQARSRLIGRLIQCHFPRARSFLEVGCGTGFVVQSLRRALPSLSLTATELYSEGIARAAAKLPHVRFVQSDVRRLPFAGRFDVVGAFDVIEHIDEDEECLREVQRALRADGGLLLTVPQHPSLWSAHDEQDRHKRRYTRSELVRKVRNAGFEVVYVGSFVTLLLPFMLVSRLMDGAEAPDPRVRFKIDPTMNRALDLVMRLELILIDRLHLSLPFGGSLALVARKQQRHGR